MDFLLIYLYVIWNYFCWKVCWTTQDHVVFAGSCVGKSDDFCARQVENSICNTEKNECFCKRGYVAIREEEDKVSCKTLLTDLKCRMDRDCYHVNKSTCHPGAGYCSCPGHTIYSSELHACRPKAYQIENNQFCRKCQAEGGVCFIYEPFDKREKYFKIDQEYLGCACPNRRTYEKENRNEICTVNFVDIGDYCDDTKDVCRTKIARCQEKSAESQIKVCQCPKDHVKLYQSNLHYHECFPILTTNSPLCSLCLSSKGICYDINGDGIGDGCKCSIFYSSPEKNAEFKHQNEFCSIKHIESSCEDGNLKVCYRPHSEPPYEYLKEDLISKRAAIRLIGTNENNHNSGCMLQYIKEENRFCAHINLLDQVRECGIRSYRIAHRKLQYEFILEILSNRSFKDPSKDMQFPISCIAKEITKSTKPLITATNSTNGQSDRKHFKSDKFSLDLQVLDNNNNEIQSVEEGSIIKLDASLIDPSGKYKAISVEQCYFSNDSSVSSDDVLPEKSVLLINKGCPNLREGFMANFKSNVMPGIHIQSDGFHAFRLSRTAGAIFIDCYIKICRDEASCWQLDCKNSPLRTPQINFDKTSYTIVRRRTQLNVVTKDRVKNPPGEKKNKCSYAVCLTVLQTSIMAALLITLVILITIIMIVIYRKNKLYQEHSKLSRQCLTTGTSGVFYPRYQIRGQPMHPVRHRCIAVANDKIISPNLTQSEYLPSPFHKIQVINDYDMDSLTIGGQLFHAQPTHTDNQTPSGSLPQIISQSENITRV